MWSTYIALEKDEVDTAVGAAATCSCREVYGTVKFVGRFGPLVSSSVSVARMADENYEKHRRHRNMCAEHGPRGCGLDGPSCHSGWTTVYRECAPATGRAIVDRYICTDAWITAIVFLRNVVNNSPLCMRLLLTVRFRCRMSAIWIVTSDAVGTGEKRRSKVICELVTRLYVGRHPSGSVWTCKQDGSYIVIN